MVEYSESFIINIVSLFIALIVLIVRQIYKSKCIEFSICCFSFKRDVKLEADIEKYKIDHNIKDSENNINLENNNNINK